MNLQFKALQDETRRHILELLRDRDLTAGEIGDAFTMSAPSISYHLDLLRRAGLVSSRKQRQYVTYSLETTVLDETLSWILDLVKKGKSHAEKKKADNARLAGKRAADGTIHLPGGAVG